MTREASSESKRSQRDLLTSRKKSLVRALVLREERENGGVAHSTLQFRRHPLAPFSCSSFSPDTGKWEGDYFTEKKKKREKEKRNQSLA